MSNEQSQLDTWGLGARVGACQSLVQKVGEKGKKDVNAMDKRTDTNL
jgi:hypothetical protein